MERLLAIAGDPKTIKSLGHGYLTGILYLLPADLGDDGQNLCPFATPGCRDSCLNKSGRGGLPKGQASRLRKRRMFFDERATFLGHVVKDIERLVRRAARLGLKPCVRLNGTSDIAWELIAPWLFTRFPTVQFYDYTKIAARVRRMRTGRWPSNYYLAFSRSETNDRESLALLAAGESVAVVFGTKKGRPLPAEWHGYRVVDGDASDLRFLDPRGVVIGLRAKGRAKLDRTGFVVRDRTDALREAA